MVEMIVELLQRPSVQVLVSILLTIVSVFIIRPKNADKTWTVAGFVFVGFMMVNSVFIFTVADSWMYFFYSLGFSVAYLISMAFVIPTLIKLLKMEGSGESAMVFIFIIYHPLSLLFMLFLKWTYFRLL